MSNLMTQHMSEFHRLLDKKAETSLYLQSNKDEAIDLARKVPIDMLALEWLNEIDASIETRAYLVENFLPVLVLGCEKVLKEASKRKLIDENKSDLNYNPINFLAQFLMRNNPKYNNNNETSSYVRTLRQVYQELREQMFAFQENKLAKIKADVRQRRDEREKQEKLKQLEKERRKLVIDSLFKKWLISVHGRLEMAILQNAFDMYHNKTESLPIDMRPFAKLNIRSIPAACFVHDKLNFEKRLLKSEFVQCLLNVSENMSSEIFDFFTTFIQDCAEYFIYMANKNSTSKILYKLFELLDTTKSGVLSRKQLLEVLLSYFKLNESTFRDPFRWPVLDPFIKFENEELIKQTIDENELEFGKDDTVKSQEFENAENENVDGNILNDAKLMENKPSEALPTDPLLKLESNSDVDKVNSIEAESLAKITAPTEPRALENFDENEEVNEEKAEKIEETKPEPKKLIEIEPKKNLLDQEIMFIKGGIMYYSPLQEPLNAFDRVMITNHIQNSDFSRFNTEYIDSNQFVNLLNNYCFTSIFKSEKETNRFINYVKDNYIEKQMDRNKKMEYVSLYKKFLTNEEKFSKIFDKLDNEASGYLNFNVLISLLEKFKDGMYKETIQNTSMIMKNKLNLNEDIEMVERLELNKEDFINYLSLLIDQVRSPIFVDQMCQYLMSVLQFDYPQRVRGEHRKNWLEQIRLIGETLIGGFEPLYKQLFSSLLKDAENHGEGKNISAYVAILEKTTTNGLVLRYHASTPQDSKFILGKTLTRKNKNISFGVVDSGQFIHIPRVRTQENIHYFDPHCDRDGSLIIMPLMYRRNRIYGVIGIDTLQEASNRSYFQEHEVKFYQGIASTFAKSYANIIFKNRLIKCCIDAIDWIHQRCQTVQECKLYFVDANSSEVLNSVQEANKKKINLKQILRYSVKEQKLQDNTSKVGLQRTKSQDSSVKSGNLKDQNNSNSYVGNHVYECAISSESTVGYFGADVSYCYSLRNEEHKTIFVFEVFCKGTNKDQNSDIVDIDQLETVFYILHKCQEELLEESLLGKTKSDFEFEDLNEQDKSEILFEKRFFNYIHEKLKSHSNEIIIDSSNASTKAKSIIDTVGDILNLQELSLNKMISQEFLNKLKLFDPTKMNVHISNNKMDLEKTELKSLHSLQVELNSEHKLVALLVDWLCILKLLKQKIAKILKKN